MIPFSIRHLESYCMIVRLSPEAQPFALLEGSRCIVDLAARPAFREMLSIPASEGYARVWGVAPSLIYRARIAMGLSSQHGGQRVRSGRRPNGSAGAPPLALLSPEDMGVSVQVVGSGTTRTLVVTLDKQPMCMLAGTMIIIEIAATEELRDYLRGVTIEEAMATLKLTNRSVVRLRKYVGVKGWVP